MSSGDQVIHRNRNIKCIEQHRARLIYESVNYFKKYWLFFILFIYLFLGFFLFFYFFFFFYFFSNFRQQYIKLMIDRNKQQRNRKS